jgi:hypothetical protein
MNLKIALKTKTISQNKTNSTQQQSPNAPPVQMKSPDTTKTNTSNNPHKEKLHKMGIMYIFISTG